MAENIIVVHRPVLTDEERARRMEQIRQAAVKLILAAERVRMEEKRNEARGY